jgi:hypothetical protein
LRRKSSRSGTQKRNPFVSGFFRGFSPLYFDNTCRDTPCRVSALINFFLSHVKTFCKTSLHAFAGYFNFLRTYLQPLLLPCRGRNRQLPAS